MEKRYRFLQVFFLLGWLILGTKLAYEQLYRNIFSAETLSFPFNFNFWLQQLSALF